MSVRGEMCCVVENSGAKDLNTQARQKSLTSGTCSLGAFYCARRQRHMFTARVEALFTTRWLCQQWVSMGVLRILCTHWVYYGPLDLPWPSFIADGPKYLFIRLLCMVG